jgi:hypothetical protein
MKAVFALLSTRQAFAAVAVAVALVVVVLVARRSLRWSIGQGAMEAHDVPRLRPVVTGMEGRVQPAGASRLLPCEMLLHGGNVVATNDDKPSYCQQWTENKSGIVDKR